MTNTADLERARACAGTMAGVRDDLRGAVAQVEDAQLTAVLETAAEVLDGLRQTFVHYGEGSEPAWRR